MYMNNYIRSLDIAEGSTLRFNCPECKGRNTFTVTNNNGQLLWNCYKVSCNVSGTHKVGMSAKSIYKRLNMLEDNYTTEFCMPINIVPLSGEHEHAMAWAMGWGLSPNQHGLMYDIREHRVVFPIVHDGVAVDATGRAIGKRLPKWKRYGNNRLPYVYGYGNVAVVVEDCISAAIIGSDRHTGIALMGTSMSNEQKKYLSQFSTALVALDPDALSKALQISKELKSVVERVKLVMLKDDLKYRNDRDIELINMA